MSWTGMQLDAMIDEIQARVGREDDTALITDARLTLFINEAQRYIAKKVKGIPELYSKDTSLTTVTDQVEYSISTIDPCHILGVWYIDGSESKRLTYLYHDVFDDKAPDPTHADFAATKPAYYTRRGSNIQIWPRPSASYASKTLRVDYQKWPTDLSGTATSDLERMDEGLLLYGEFKAWIAIGGPTGQEQSEQKWALFQDWLRELRDYLYNNMDDDDNIPFDGDY